ncbi:Probable nitronate monooxygenase [Seminavis robusta]|uniref:Probable nitronate monooxygenase n=1 Tax=Seminavis robusta TaxID=568900 RepID=A0A9N8EL25_9STRA|nr:Probable nitronate monooxygenase [Seminavis robusta]|eukprot:Sro1262_g257140.1 Probable nitronate monooxygenase (359) ;mRNA; f:22168-23244
MSWKTRFVTQFPAKVPLMAAPMAGVSGGELASEACRAGALGFIAAGHMTTDSRLQELEAEIAIFRAKATKEAPLCIGWIGFSSFHTEQGFDIYERILKQQKPAVVQFFAPAISYHPTTGKSNVEIAKEIGNTKVLLQVGNVKEGEEAIAAGADGIIAQGSEGGGHGLRREVGNGTLPLAARMVKLAAAAPHKPLVLAAGGIADGRGVAAALALGCDAAVLGTRLWASKEALNKDVLKQQLVVTKSGDGVHRTRVFDQIQNVYLNPPWPEPYDSCGALRNELSEAWDGKPSELAAELSREGSTVVEEYKAASKKGDHSQAQVLAGEGVGEIESIDAAYEILMQVDKEAREVIANLPKLL